MERTGETGFISDLQTPLTGRASKSKTLILIV
jgi:hypothetical protein